MDYKYIEQLLESYFDCRTTLQEEQILRVFFAQEDVPGHLAQYADLFKYEKQAGECVLDEAFEQRVLEKIEKADDCTRKPTLRVTKKLTRRFAPFFRAAAVVAMALTIGRAAEHAIGEHEAESADNVAAVNPYVKAADVQQAIRVRDVNQAEMKVENDTISGVVSNEVPKGKM